MKKKRYMIHFVCIVFMFSIIGSGCSKKSEETTNKSNQVADGAAAQETVTTLAAKEEVTTPTSQEEVATPVVEEVTVVPESEDSNSPWKLLSETTVDTKVNYAGFLNESIGVTVGYSGATSYTEDGGKTWSQSSNVSSCRYGLDLYNESLFVDSGNSGVNLASKDKGKTWYKLGDFPLKNGEFNKFLSIVDEKNIYIGASKALAVSTDGGSTWNELEVPKEVKKLVGMFFLSTETGYLMNSDGTLFKTVDSCETWTTQKLDLSGESIINYATPSATINFQDENKGMIIIATKDYEHLCLKTEDGGSTWEKVTMPKTSGQSPYLSRNGQYLTLSTATKKISLYKLEVE